MNKKFVLPNNPLFFLQFILFPALIAFICHKLGFTMDSIVNSLGSIRVIIIIFAYFLFIIGMVFSAIVVITDEYVSGPGNALNLFPVKLPLVGSECSFEDRRTGKFRCECLIIRNAYKEICLPNVYFTYELFDEIINLIQKINERK